MSRMHRQDPGALTLQSMRLARPGLMFFDAAFRRPLVAVAALTLLCLALFVPGIASLPPTDRDESRFVQATRQMHESGNYIDIRFQDEVRYKKPVGIYWLQALATAPLGGAEAPIWAHRVPSLFGAIAAVIAVFFCGRTLFGAREGLMAGLLFAPVLLLGVEAHLAKTDAVLLAMIVAAQNVLARAWMRAPRRGEAASQPGQLPVSLCLLFWGALGAAVLVKGPIAPLVLGATSVGLSLALRSAIWMRALRPLLGVGVVLAVTLPWLAAIAVMSEGAFFREAVGNDFLGKIGQGQEGHAAPPGSYLLAFPITGWPLAPLAIAALPAAIQSRREPAVLFCLAWLVPCWIMFEAVATKLPHYVLPLYPALALLAGASLARNPALLAAGWRRGLALLLLVPAGIAVGMILVPMALETAVPAPAVLLGTASALAAVLALAAFWRGRADWGLLACLAAAVLMHVGVYRFALPALGSLRVSERLAAAAEAASCADPVLGVAGYAEPSLVFAAGTGTRLGNATEVAEWLAEPGCRVAAVEQREQEAFRAAALAAGLDLVEIGAVTGFNYSRGDRVEVRLYRVGHGARAALP